MRQVLKKLLQKIWNDPVLSIVIAAGIIALFGIAGNWYQRLDGSISNNTKDGFANDTFEVNNQMSSDNNDAKSLSDKKALISDTNSFTGNTGRPPATQLGGNPPTQTGGNSKDTIVLYAKTPDHSDEKQQTLPSNPNHETAPNSNQFETLNTDKYFFKKFYDVDLKLSTTPKRITVIKENMWVYFKLQENKHRGFFMISNNNNLYFTPAENIVIGNTYPFYSIVNCIKTDEYTTYEAERCENTPFFKIQTLRIFMCKGVDFQHGTYFNMAKTHRLDF